MVSAEDITRRDAAIEEIATRLGVRAERGKRFAELTSLRVGGAVDALALAEEIRGRVKQEHGIDLEYEVELWSSKTDTEI